MSKRVRVVHPPMSVARDFIDYPYHSNLGAVQLAGELRRIPSVQLSLLDAFSLPSSTLSWRSDGRALLGTTVENILSAAVDLEHDDWIFVAYTPFHRPPHRDDVLGALLSALRERAPTAKLLLADCYQSGQHYIESAGEAVLQAYPEIDAWLKYEAEQTAVDLVNGTLSLPSATRTVLHGQEPAELDALAEPAWDLVSLPHYERFQHRVVQHLGRGSWAFPIDGRTLPMVTSRGCPFTCAHCSSNPGRAPDAPKTQRRYSRAVLRERLERMKSAFGATRVALLDEMVNINAKHFDGLLEDLQALQLRFDVPNGMRADYLFERHLRAMKGLVTTVSVSAESGSQRVVSEVVGKRLDLQELRRAAREAHTVGVPMMVHYMIGLPGETGEEINETLAFAMDLFEDYGAFPAVQFATPLPGTDLAKGRSLPVVHDWGPLFQTKPSQPGALVQAEQLRAFKQTFERRVQAASGPTKLVMNVTYQCNNHCTFCAVGTRTQVDGHPQRQREHLDKYRALGVTMVDFDGGEPTLNPELIPLIRYARKIGYQRVNVTTNGRRCVYEPFAKALVRSGITTLLFSVHGPDAQTHAQQVGVAEAFEQTMEGIRLCKQLAPSTVELGMNITLTKSNYRKLEAVTQLAWDAGLRWLNVQFLTPFGRATRWIAPDTKEAAEETMAVIDRWHERMKFQVINLPFCFLPKHEEYLHGDLGKLQRHMVFVNNEDVNLAEYLAERRAYKPECGPCPHRIFCGGFYELEDAPEPPWLIRPEDLLRPVLRKDSPIP